MRTDSDIAWSLEVAAHLARDAPWEPALREVHERWAIEVVEGLNLCPFARKSRELGRVHRPIFACGAAREIPAGVVAQAIIDVQRGDPAAEIVLPTFAMAGGHPWLDLRVFERFVDAVRAQFAALGPVRPAYMVAFHPSFLPIAEPDTTADNLVPLLRRTPDPLIQVVDAQVLDRMRRQTQQQARERMLAELERRDPAVAKLFAASVQTDAELGEDIARHNLRAVGHGSGRARLEALVDALARARAEIDVRC